MSGQDVDDFLAHYGIPGMKWGVRRQNLRTASSNVKEAKQILKEAKGQQREARKAAAKTVAQDAVVIAGVALAIKVLSSGGKTPFNKLKTSSFSAGADWVNKSLKSTDASNWATTKIKDL